MSNKKHWKELLYCPTSTHNSTTFYNHIPTLKLTRWLPRHTTRRLYSTTLRATSEGSVTKVGLAIADKSGLTRWQENPSPYRQGGSPYGALPNRLALRQSLGLATFRPRGMKSTRSTSTSAARAKELGENEGVADNGLPNTNTYYQQQMMIRADTLEIPATLWCPSSRNFLWITWIKIKQFFFTDIPIKVT
jgi:hypothetical protein